MTKIVFSSDQFGPDLPERRKMALWQDFFSAHVLRNEFVPSEAPFAVQMEVAPVGDLLVSRMMGSFSGASQARAETTEKSRDRMAMFIWSGASPMTIRQCDREVGIASGGVALVNGEDAASYNARVDHAQLTLIDIPKSIVLPSVPHVESFVGQSFAPDNEAMSMLIAQANLILKSGVSNPALNLRMAETLSDLFALAVGAEYEAAEMANSRGLRRSRLDAILRTIAEGFHDPDFSIAKACTKLRMSERYVQDILQESGVGFSARVIEARLAHAAELLAHAVNAHRKISDIAYASGFSDLSYFNRCFRRKFGMTPAGARFC